MEEGRKRLNSIFFVLIRNMNFIGPIGATSFYLVMVVPVFNQRSLYKKILRTNLNKHLFY